MANSRSIKLLAAISRRRATAWDRAFLGWPRAGQGGPSSLSCPGVSTTAFLPPPIDSGTSSDYQAMFHLVYVSSAAVPFSQAELLDLLATSRENNARAGLTGLLLYKDGNFMQALEGEEHAVRATHARIERDRRHRGLLTILQEPVLGRRFPDWSMGLKVLDSPELVSAPGFSPFLNTPLTAAEFAGDPSRSEKLLLSFRRHM